MLIFESVFKAYYLPLLVNNEVKSGRVFKQKGISASRNRSFRMKMSSHKISAQFFEKQHFPKHLRNRIRSFDYFCTGHLEKHFLLEGSSENAFFVVGGFY